MRLIESDLRRLADVALNAAAAAGEMIATARPNEIDRKSDDGSLASQVVTDVDRRSEAIIEVCNRWARASSGSDAVRRQWAKRRARSS